MHSYAIESSDQAYSMMSYITVHCVTVSQLSDL